MSLDLYGLMGRQDYMPGDIDSGDTIFESDENLTEDEGAGRQPLFSSPDDMIAGWLEQDREGNYYISLQIQFFGQKFNVPLFVNDDREKSHQIMNKAGTVLTED